jgi:hypothetical protein
MQNNACIGAHSLPYSNGASMVGHWILDSYLTEKYLICGVRRHQASAPKAVHRTSGRLARRAVLS